MKRLALALLLAVAPWGPCERAAYAAGCSGVVMPEAGHRTTYQQSIVNSSQRYTDNGVWRWRWGIVWMGWSRFTSSAWYDTWTGAVYCDPYLYS